MQDTRPGLFRTIFRRLFPPRTVEADALTWPEFEVAPVLAFVDVDGTLLAETTTYLFARILRRRGLIKSSFILRALYHGLQHRFGRLDYGRLVAFGMKSVSTVQLSDLEKIAADNFEQHVRPRLYEGVEEHFAGLRSRGTQVVLVSSSPALVIEPLARHLGCAATITTPVVIEDGRLIGPGDGPPCYGEGKRYWALRWAADHGIPMDLAAAYGDNWSDRALLGTVGRAVVVHPKGKLRRLAIEQGWSIARPRSPARRTRGRFSSGT
ncbi:MAG: HAD-superfamily subfamily hydrolase [Planctomycetota bacterium]|nr:HAD-superfamily subfamily hydrolase [Planctomycetota bacterium]